jgi:adenylate cyclase
MESRVHIDLFDHRSLGGLTRKLRLTSGLILFAYVTAHLSNHALGLLSLDAAETGLRIGVAVWHSWAGTGLLYGAAAIHILLAFWAVYVRRTFRLPPAELLRIVLGLWLPVLLIGHVAATRIAYELFGSASDYSHVVTNMWITDAQGRQLGLLAPGWVHGCLGLHYAFNRYTIYRRLKYLLFAIALLVPVLSALGFVTLGRELIDSPIAAAAAYDYLSPSHAAERAAIERLRDGSLAVYFVLVGAIFAARTIRSQIEKRRKRLISISYPIRTVSVPRGWTVLEASRAFRIPHASMCGGQARCTTCRVRVTAGENFCPPPKAAELATLHQMGATRDIRLACQLRPQGSISVVPLIHAEHLGPRPIAPQRSAEREIVCVYCDFLNRSSLAENNLPQDVFYAFTRHIETVGNVIRAAGGTLSYVEIDSVCGLFGLRSELKGAAEQALRAGIMIEDAIAGLRKSIGDDYSARLDVAISLNTGSAVVGEISSPEGPMVIALGPAIDGASKLRKIAAKSKFEGLSFAISTAVFKAAATETTVINGVAFEISEQNDAFLSNSLGSLRHVLPRVPVSTWPSTLRRLWAG